MANTQRNVWEFYTTKTTPPGSRHTEYQHRWRCRDLNGEIIGASTEGYTDKRDAEANARRFGWVPEDEVSMRDRAEALWGLLDDIDTLDDAARDDDAGFRNATREIIRKRVRYFLSEDGQTLTLVRLKKK